MTDAISSHYIAASEELGIEHSKVPFKEKAIDFLKKKGLPTKKWENWKYSLLNKGLEVKFKNADHISPAGNIDIQNHVFESSSGRIVFYNGSFCETLSSLPEGLKVRLIDALEANDILSREDWKKDSEDDPFDALNLASLKKVLHLQIPAKTKIEGVLEIHHLMDEKFKGFMAHPRILVEASEFSDIQILENFSSLKDENPDFVDKNPYFLNSQSQFLVGKGARVLHVKEQAQDLGSLHVGGVWAKLKRDSYFHSFTFNIGASFARHNLDILLSEEGAEAKVNGLYALTSDQHCDNFGKIEHMKPHTYSGQLFKGILDEKAHGVFTGMVRVHRDAQQISSEQLNKNLLLNNKAHVNTRPILEIYADDVKCAHGATIGQLSDEEIFYLRSRGMSLESAQMLLSQGFGKEAVMTIESKPIQERLNTLLLKRFEKFHVGGN